MFFVSEIFFESNQTEITKSHWYKFNWRKWSEKKLSIYEKKKKKNKKNCLDEMEWNSNESFFPFSSNFNEINRLLCRLQMNEKVEKNAGKSERNKHTATEDKALNLKFGIYTPHYFDLSVVGSPVTKKKEKKNYHSNDSTKWFYFVLIFFHRAMEKGFQMQGICTFQSLSTHNLYARMIFNANVVFCINIRCQTEFIWNEQASKTKSPYCVCMYGFGVVRGKSNERGKEETHEKKQQPSEH